MTAPQTAPQAEFQSAGKPVASPIYLVDQNGNPITSANPFGGNITQINSAAVSNTNPFITETNIQNWIRSGQGFIVTTGVLVTQTNANLTVGGMSVFNNSTAKNILIYSIQIMATSGAYININATTADAAFSAARTPTNLLLGSGTASVATCNSSANNVSASVTPIGTLLMVGTQATGTQVFDNLTNGASILLPVGSAHGIAVYPFIAAAGNQFVVTVKMVEF